MTTEQEIKMLQFDGVGDHVDCGQNVLSGDTDFTVSAWIKTTTTSQGVIIQQRDPDGYNGEYALGVLSTGVVRIWTYKDDYKWSVASTDPINDGKWHHVAAVQSDNEGMLYIDGVEAGADSGGRAALDGSLNTYIGADVRDNIAYFQGLIAEVRVWNCARAPEQIKANMKHFLTGREPGLVGYWRLNEGVGNIAKDITGTSDGAIRQCSWIDTIPPSTPEIGKAIQFNGEGDCVKVDSFSGFPSDAITVEMWIRSSDKTKKGTPFSYAVPGEDNAFLIFDHNNLSLEVNHEQKPSGISLTDGLWHHLAVSWNSIDGVGIVHVDGRKEFSATQAKGKSIPDKGVLVLGQEQDVLGGGFDPTQAFMGEMCDVRIWNVVRTTEEVKRDMYFRLSGKEPGLVAYWQMNEKAGTTLRDITTVNTNDGTLIGCSLIDSEFFLKSDPMQQMLNLRLDWEKLQGWVKDLKIENRSLVQLNPDGKNVPNLISTHSDVITNKDAKITELDENISRINNENTVAVDIRDKEINNIKKINRMLINTGGFTLSINDESVIAMKANSVHSAVAKKIKGVQGKTYDELIAVIRGKLTTDEYNDNETKILESVKMETPMVTLENLIGNANVQIKNARQTLEENQSSHRLENVHMEMKMVPGASGTAMTFPKVDDLKGADHISDLSVINLDFTPRETTKKEVRETTPTPNLIGYTEIMATRRLDAVNLIGEINYKAVKSKEEENRVVFQYPAVGKDVPPMSVVIIAIGKLIKEIETK